MSNRPAAATSPQRRERHPDGLRIRNASNVRRARLERLVSAVVAPFAALAALQLLYVVALNAWRPGAPGVTPTVDEVVLGLLSWAAVALCSWLALGVTLTALTTLPGRVGRWVGVLADRVTPTVLRRSLTMLLGVSVGTTALPAGPAFGAVTSLGAADGHSGSGGVAVTEAGPGWEASPSLAPPSPAVVPTPFATAGTTVAGTDPSATPEALDARSLDPGFRASEQPDRHRTRRQSPRWRPTAPVRTTRAPSSLLTPPPRTASAPIERVTVRRGDSLWSIVARHLGPSATDAEIAHEWPRWFAANAAVIGDDPDLILPGQQLLPPPLEGACP